MWRTPDYVAVPLAAPPVTAAAFSADDGRFVTGHEDGVLRLWDARTGRLVAESPS
jgi:WD40 repeat protein